MQRKILLCVSKWDENRKNLFSIKTFHRTFQPSSLNGILMPEAANPRLYLKIVFVIWIIFRADGERCFDNKLQIEALE